MEKELTNVIDNNLKYKNCDRFKDSNKRITNFCKVVQNHTKKYKEYYKNYINELLSDHKTKLPKTTTKKYLPILEIIVSHKPELKNKVDDFISTLNDISYVTDESGNWHPVNKLNTNYSDLSEMISYMVEKFFGNKSTDTFFTKLLNRELAYEYLKNYDGTNNFIVSLKKQYEDNKHLSIDQLISLGGNFDIFNHDFFMKEALEKVLNKKVILSVDEIKTFINNTVKNSHEGEIVEEIIEKVFLDNGWDVVYKGGNGDFIDMKFGIDLIVEKNGTYKFVQTKKVWDIKYVDETIMRKKEDGGSYMVSGRVSDVREDTIDLLGLGTIDGKYIITGKQNDVVEYKENGQVKYKYVDKKILPSPKMGFCYVDEAFENMKKIIC